MRRLDLPWFWLIFPPLFQGVLSGNPGIPMLALLLASGPSQQALVPSPIYRAMQAGKFARFEEITRTTSEIQDALISLLSEKQIAVPELGEIVTAQRGFNIIATANTRDRGVNEMSAALKRRFNFETVFPIADFDTELALVEQEAAKLLERSGVELAPKRDVLEVLVKTFRDLREGNDRLTTVMSTAEAVSVAHAVGLRGWFLRGEAGSAADVVECLAGTAAKDNAEDLARLRRYLEQHAPRCKGKQWQELHRARHLLPG